MSWLWPRWGCWSLSLSLPDQAHGSPRPTSVAFACSNSKATLASSQTRRNLSKGFSTPSRNCSAPWWPRSWTVALLVPFVACYDSTRLCACWCRDWHQCGRLRDFWLVSKQVTCWIGRLRWGLCSSNPNATAVCFSVQTLRNDRPSAQYDSSPKGPSWRTVLSFSCSGTCNLKVLSGRTLLSSDSRRRSRCAA